MNTDLKKRLEEYDILADIYRRLSIVVSQVLEKTMSDTDLRPMQIVSRIKTKESVAEKMSHKHDKYHYVRDINDLLGFRIIFYFSDQMDICAEAIKKAFNVDPKRSKDKRQLIDPTAFGYISLHYICSLPEDQGYPVELCGRNFEIQIRTVLQHTWAEIEHDLGYKSEFDIPREIRREFSRVAGLLEVADEVFVNLKKRIGDYKLEVCESISNDEADDMTLDLITLTEYMNRSRTMTALLSDISAVSGAGIKEVSPEYYVERLHFLGIQTLGDLKRFNTEEYDHALLLARNVLADKDIEELISTVGFFYLCRARLVFGDMDEKRIYRYYRIDETDPGYAAEQTEHIMYLRKLMRHDAH
ncbi:MAG: hypothetical protein J6I96_07825 [Oscillospiraceae bacterium]|nr:hypothetical protein [Oscillospiraceae bacterium]